MPQDEVDVRVRHELAAVVDGVGVPGGSHARPLDDVVKAIIEVEVGDDDPAARRALGHRDRHVRLRLAHEVDWTEVRLVRRARTNAGRLEKSIPLLRTTGCSGETLSRSFPSPSR